MRWVRATLTGCLVSQCTSWEHSREIPTAEKAFALVQLPWSDSKIHMITQFANFLLGWSSKLPSILAFSSVLLTLTSMGSVTADIWKCWAKRQKQQQNGNSGRTQSWSSLLRASFYLIRYPAWRGIGFYTKGWLTVMKAWLIRHLPGIQFWLIFQRTETLSW